MGTRNVVRRTLLSTLFLLPLFAPDLLAQNADLILGEPATVGTSPAQIVIDEDRGEIHVLHAGTDKNYNGIVELDSGDVAASWYKLDRSGQVIDSLDFGLYFNSYPVRGAFDFEGGVLYAPIGGVVASYDTETMSVLNPSLVVTPGAGVTWDEATGSIAIAIRADDFTSPGALLFYNPSIDLVVGSFLAGVNPADGITGIVDEDLDLSRLFVMNEGGGSGDASLTMFGISYDVYNAVNGVGIGAGGWTAVVDDAEAFILFPTADFLRVIDRTTHEELEKSPIRFDDSLTALDVAVDADYVAILSINGNLLIYDRDDYRLLERRSVPKSARRIAVGHGNVYVVGPYKPKGDSTTSVTVVKVGGSTREIGVGRAPSAVWSLDGERILVIGDNGSSGWWRVISQESGEISVSGEIPINNVDAENKSAFDRERGLLGVIDGSVLIEIDITADQSNGDTIWSSDELYVDRLVAGDGIWLMANYPGDFVPDPGVVVGVDMKTGLERGSVVLSISIPMLPIPALSSVEGAGAFYALPTAPFGGPDAELAYVEYHSNLFEGTLGNFANHITRGAPEYCQEEFYTMVTLSGSHEVVYLSGLETIPQISSRTATGTSGFDGPRASSLAPCVPAIFCGATLTTTYGGDLILHFEGNILDVQQLPGRGEGLALFGDTAWAANVLEIGSFTEPGMTVTPATVKWPGSVAENLLPEQRLTVRHNRSAGELSIRLELESVGEVEIRLIDMNGRPVLTPAAQRAEPGSNTTTLTTRALPTGPYLLTVETEEGSAVRTVEVVR